MSIPLKTKTGSTSSSLTSVGGRILLILLCTLLPKFIPCSPCYPVTRVSPLFVCRDTNEVDDDLPDRSFVVWPPFGPTWVCSGTQLLYFNFQVLECSVSCSSVSYKTSRRPLVGPEGRFIGSCLCTLLSWVWTSFLVVFPIFLMRSLIGYIPSSSNTRVSGLIF